MADDTPRGVVRAIASLVAYNWADEEADYNTTALEPGNSREGHIFGDLMTVQRWLETFGYPHVQPRTEPEGTPVSCPLHPVRPCAGCTACEADPDRWRDYYGTSE